MVPVSSKSFFRYSPSIVCKFWNSCDFICGYELCSNSFDAKTQETNQPSHISRHFKFNQFGSNSIEANPQGTNLHLHIILQNIIKSMNWVPTPLMPTRRNAKYMFSWKLFRNIPKSMNCALIPRCETAGYKPTLAHF